MPDLEECERVVTEAIKVGYRLLDTAQVYGNEEAVGNAVRKSGLAREEFFITTKVWISNAGYEKAKASLDESLRKLQTDYVDLVLIWCLFINLLAITMVLGVLWKHTINPAKSKPSVSVIFTQIV